MAALVAETRLTTQPRGRTELLVVSGSRIFSGAMVSRSSVNGLARPTDHNANTSDEILGLAINVPYDVGHGSNSVLGDGMTAKVEIDTSGLVLENVPVAGAGNVGALIFAPTDDPQTDLTLTAAGNGQAIGRSVRIRESTNRDVRLFTEEEARKEVG